MLAITVGAIDYPLEDGEARVLAEWLRRIDKPDPRLKTAPRPGALDTDATAAAVVIEAALATPEEARTALDLGDEELRDVANVVAFLADESLARAVKLDTWTSPRLRALDAALRDHLDFSPPPSSL